MKVGVRVREAGGRLVPCALRQSVAQVEDLVGVGVEVGLGLGLGLA